jgi:epsilon-lactone hydrolase
MTSLRARLTNRFLRLTTKSAWRPDLTVGELRAHAARIDARLGRRAPSLALEQVQAGTVPATWIGEPALAERGTILYLHGGAFCLDLPAAYRRMCGRIAELAGMRVLLVDYRLAPEHVFPAGVEDCLASYRWLLAQGHGTRPLAVAGDSAGGNLTAVTLQRARDAGLPLPRCAVLLSPATDLTFSGPSVQYNERADPMFSAAAGELMANTYCPGADRADARISPLFGDWRGLPPLLFHAGSTEMLLDDAVRAHDRARVAGGTVDIRVWGDLPHVFHLFPWLPESRAGLTELAAFVHRHCR